MSDAANPSPMISDGSSAWQSAWRFGLWFLLALLGSVGIGWTSTTIQSAGLAPLILSSLMVGAVSGGLLILLARWIGCGQKWSMLTASIVLGLIVAVMQHVFAYQAYYATYQATIENNAKAALAKTLSPEVGPSGFVEYMQAEGGKTGYVWMWSIDAAIIAITTISIVWLGNRRPYCDLCHSWYHLSRESGIPNKLFPAVREITKIELPGDATMTKYQLFQCLRGCGPSRVTLSWVIASGKAKQQSVWLDALKRDAWDDSFKMPDTKV